MGNRLERLLSSLLGYLKEANSAANRTQPARNTVAFMHARASAILLDRVDLDALLRMGVGEGTPGGKIWADLARAACIQAAIMLQLEISQIQADFASQIAYRIGHRVYTYRHLIALGHSPSTN
jgi:hypothetical protein